VKNEEVCLAKCLNSIKEVDEIVVVYSKSIDRTKEIAKEFTSLIYEDFVWCDDFAAARNYGIERCTGDWILSVDADEVLEENGVAKIRNVIPKTNKDAIDLHIVQTSGNYHKFPKLFRNRKDIRYHNAIHEVIHVKSKDWADIKLYHDPSPSHAYNPDRNMKLLTKEIEKNPKNARTIYYLAREYFYKEDWRTCVEWLLRYIEIGKWKPELSDALLYLAKCFSNINVKDYAKYYCEEAIKLNHNFAEAIRFILPLCDEEDKERYTLMLSKATNEHVLFIRV
jgi:glycosyltransferase involved in cell wall biosynthesis